MAKASGGATYVTPTLCGMWERMPVTNLQRIKLGSRFLRLATCRFCLTPIRQTNPALARIAELLARDKMHAQSAKARNQEVGARLGYGN